MIDGVVVKSLTVHQDAAQSKEYIPTPGFLMEVVRNDEGILKQFGQTTFTVTHEGSIKAFHVHDRQDDLWFVATGKATVVLHDLRPDSPTRGQTDVMSAGANDYKVILIPAGVAHGYKVESREPVLLFYHTTKPYDANHPDERRIPYDDPLIGFDWNAESR